MNLMQDKNNKYVELFNLSELYSSDDLKKLFKIIPELLKVSRTHSNSVHSKTTELFKFMSDENIDNINISGKPLKINKFLFIKVILLKLKSYFEVNESFIFMKTLSILISEIKNLEKYLVSNSHSSKSKTRNEKILHKSSKKPEKIHKENYKTTNVSLKTSTKNNGLNSTNYFILNNGSKGYNDEKNKKKKVYFRAIDYPFKKENKNEAKSFCTKLKYNSRKKSINTTLNETERKIQEINLSLSEIKKYEFEKKISKQSTSSNIDLNLYMDSDINTDSQISQNYSNNLENKLKKKYFATLQNKSDLFNNNNNLYINIYEQKKNNGNSKGEISEYIHRKTTDKSISKNDNNNLRKSILNISLLDKIETEDFNIFEVDKKSSGNTLVLISCYIFNRFGFHNLIKYSNFENWCSAIASGYNRKNPYHTDLHAGDITQTCLVYFKIGKINEICKFNQLSKCGLFLSCICHDYKHPGVNNNFLKDTKDILAIKYNDNSILENMHISEAFKLTIDSPNCNIFSGMNSDNYKQIRKEMISCVLFTDMTRHQLTIDFMNEVNKNKNNSKKNEEKLEKDYQQDYMNLLIHSADISNPTKKFNIYWQWAEIVFEEFLEQGDKEKELGLKCSFDRDTLSIYQNQLGFINYIEVPFFTSFVTTFPKLKSLMNNLNNNKNEILALQEKDKEKKVRRKTIN